MSYQEVKALRQQGKLAEALTLAQADLDQNPSDIWNLRSISWVHYAFMKLAQEKVDLPDFIKTLNQIRALKLPANEKILFESMAWQIGKIASQFAQQHPQKLTALFDACVEIPFPKPTESYSFLLKAANKAPDNWENYMHFVKWWGIQNFHPSDYEGFVTDNGKKLISLVESTFIRMSKHLLEKKDIAQINHFLPQIADLCTSHPHYQYPHYYHAKLLLATGDKKQFLNAFLPFAKQKQRDFWVWDLLSEIFEPESNEHYSCLCRALACGAPHKFTLNVKEKLAAVFVRKAQYNFAKREFEDAINARAQNGWKLPLLLEQITYAPWWKTTQSVANNGNLYVKDGAVATEILFFTIPVENVAIEWVNTKSQVAFFISETLESGSFLYRNMNIQPHVGMSLEVRFDKKGSGESSNFYKVLTIKESNTFPSKLYKKIHAKLEIKSGNSFGFTGNAFADAITIERLKLKNGEMVNGMAMASFNKKKKQWGWKLIGTH